jgi:hypothetical protein
MATSAYMPAAYLAIRVGSRRHLIRGAMPTIREVHDAFERLIAEQKQLTSRLHEEADSLKQSAAVTLSFEGSSSICVHLRVWRSDEAFPLISHGNNDAMDAWTQHSGPGS